MAAQLRGYTKTHHIVHFKRVKLVVCKLYLNNLKKKIPQSTTCEFELGGVGASVSHLCGYIIWLFASYCVLNSSQLHQMVNPVSPRTFSQRWKREVSFCLDRLVDSRPQQLTCLSLLH